MPVVSPTIHNALFIFLGTLAQRFVLEKRQLTREWDSIFLPSPVISNTTKQERDLCNALRSLLPGVIREETTEEEEEEAAVAQEG